MKRIVKDHSVNMAIPKNQNLVIITGPENNVEMAAEEVKKIQETLDRYAQTSRTERPPQTLRSQMNNRTIQTQQEPRHSIQCRYYKRGTCNLGDQCEYLHTREADNRSRSHERSIRDTKRKGEIRSKSKEIRERSRSNIRRDRSRSTERTHHTNENRYRQSRRERNTPYSQHHVYRH